MKIWINVEWMTHVVHTVDVGYRNTLGDGNILSYNGKYNRYILYSRYENRFPEDAIISRMFL